ncbi:MAG TPA: alpha/beta hydrolase [Chloroflexia bacterium]|jgi:pimeloyl-ACP methyl ester carboxylesterase
MSDISHGQSGTIEAAAGPLYYEVAGQGHPLLLIHAGIADHRMWDDQWELYSSRYRVIRYDTRGFGSTPILDRDYSNRQDIHDLLSHLGVDKTYIVGVSRGGQIATDFTLEHPEMVDGLVLVGAGIGGLTDGPEPTPEEAQAFEEGEAAESKEDWEGLAEIDVRVWVDGFGRPGGRGDEHVREKVRQMCLENYRRPYGSGQPVVLDPPAAGRLGEIKVPTLVMVGEYDVSEAQANADALAARIPGARKVVIAGTAHVPNMERPDEFDRLVLDFLRSIDK